MDHEGKALGQDPCSAFDPFRREGGGVSMSPAVWKFTQNT